MKGLKYFIIHPIIKVLKDVQLVVSKDCNVLLRECENQKWEAIGQWTEQYLDIDIVQNSPWEQIGSLGFRM